MGYQKSGEKAFGTHRTRALPVSVAATVGVSISAMRADTTYSKSSVVAPTRFHVSVDLVNLEQRHGLVYDRSVGAFEDSPLPVSPPCFHLLS
jgi:hypothetical protein